MGRVDDPKRLKSLAGAPLRGITETVMGSIPSALLFFVAVNQPRDAQKVRIPRMRACDRNCLLSTKPIPRTRKNETPLAITRGVWGDGNTQKPSRRGNLEISLIRNAEAPI